VSNNLVFILVVDLGMLEGTKAIEEANARDDLPKFLE